MNILISKINPYNFVFFTSIFLFLIINFILLKIYIKYSYSLKLLDIPNNRSSHIKTTPKGAGIVFSLTSIFFIIFVFKSNYLLILLPLLVVGFVDDLKNIAAFPRYVIQFLTCLVIVFTSPLFNQILLSDSNLFISSSLIFLVFISTAIVNFFNFLDGLDGLISSSGFIYFLFVGFLINPIFLVIASSIFVFLIFNWSPAKVFMGDTGSTFIGAVVAIACLSNTDYLNSLIFLLMLSPLFMDAFFCIIRRLLDRQNIFKPHRSHLYQRLQQNGWTHASVSLLYAFAVLITSCSFVFFNFSIGVLTVGLILLLGLYLDRKHASPFQGNIS